MEYALLLIVVSILSTGIRMSKGESANQTANSTQNSTAPAQSLNQSLTHIITTTTIPYISTVNVQPSSTTVQSPTSAVDTFQIDAGQDSSHIEQSSDVILPPEDQRLDFDLKINTKLRWVRYLLDRTGPEFRVMKQYVEKHLNSYFKNGPGFLKTEVIEFFEEKVSIFAIIYTKKQFQATEESYEALLQHGISTEKSNILTIYYYEINPRFNDMPNEARLSPVYVGPTVKDEQQVDKGMTFLTGFGAMFVFVVVISTIGIIKYKFNNAAKESKSETGINNEGHDTQ